MLQKKAKNTKKEVLTMRIAVAIAAAILLLLLLYLIFSFYFQKHFFLNTFINGMKVSGYSVDKVQEKAEEQIRDYVLLVEGQDGTVDEIKGIDIGLQSQWGDSLEQLLKQQNGFAWIAGSFKKEEIESPALISYDEQALKDVMAQFTCMDASKQKASEDAYISDYVSGEGYSIVPSVQGTQIDSGLLEKAVEEAIDGLAEVLSLAEADCYVKPDVTEDDTALNQTLDTLNQWIGASITYEIGDDTERLDADTFHEWISVDEEGNPVLDEEQVSEFVKTMAKKYNTCYGDKKLNTSYGVEVTVSNSHYGWKVDNSAEAAEIMEEIEAGKPVTRDLNYSMVASSHTGNDYGNSYVEINLTAQHLFMYKDGVLIVESDFVSGNVSNGNSTPTGVFGLTYKERDATLRGATYESHVSYWMPFNGNVGMHDASWRSTFGASIYKKNGSHGCVNLPVSAAKTIFENIYDNYPVFVYELAGTESESAKAQDAAYAVIDLIKQIGAVTLDSEGAIYNARQQYDALSDLGKSYVTNYDTLATAEATLESLKGGQAADGTDTTGNSEVTEGNE